MIRIISQNEQDVAIFISDDAPISQVAALNLALLNKGFTCPGYDNIEEFSMFFDGKYYTGVKTLFTKLLQGQYINDIVFRRTVVDERYQEQNTIVLLPHVRHRYHNNEANNVVDITLRFQPNIDAENPIISQVKKLTRYYQSPIERNINDLIFHTLFKIQPGDNKTIETIVDKTKDIEENYRKLYLLLLISKNFSGEVRKAYQLSFTDFIRFNKKYSNIIDNISIPTNIARRRFIELCEMIRMNKVTEGIKVEDIRFSVRKKWLKADLFGIPLFSAPNLEHFLYFDHPCVNFLADYVDQTDLLPKIEARISKEIFTKM